VKKPSVTAKTIRRGRPLGSKNNPKPLEEQIKNWPAEPRQPVVDLQDLAEKLQNALAKSYVECEQLEKNVQIYQSEINRRDIIIQYLESKIA
jgi:hypothetical protein